MARATTIWPRVTAALAVGSAGLCFALANSLDQEGRTPRPRPSDRDLPAPAARVDSAAAPERSDARAARETRAFEMMERGLAALARAQAGKSDGSFEPGECEQSVPVAVAALAALAYMAGGSTPDRGPNGAELSRAIDYLISRCELSPGATHLGYIASDGDPLARMHGHGFATLALSQAYTMSPASPRGARLRAALEAATKLIEKSQGPEGGWYYEPVPSFDHENSVTVCLVQALRGARGAGVTVNADGIARAVDYIRRCQDEEGAFRYALNRPSTSAALTAASLSTLNASGVYHGPEVARGLESLSRELATREADAAIGGVRYPHYERLYVAQALFQAADPRPYEQWRARLIVELEEQQAADGTWPDRQYGDTYATAMHCLVLAIPFGMLPIFQR